MDCLCKYGTIPYAATPPHPDCGVYHRAALCADPLAIRPLPASGARGTRLVRRFNSTTSHLIARPLGVVEHLEGFLELRRDRDVGFLAGRQPRDEPFVVERNQVAVRAELAEGALHYRGQLRLALAEHDAVGIVGQIVADDLVLVLPLLAP